MLLMRPYALVVALLSLALGFLGESSTPVPACRAANFTIEPLGEFSEPTGQHTLAFGLRNRARDRCFLFGYPRVTFLDNAGAIPFTILHHSDQVLTNTRPVRIVVRSRKAAFVVVNKYRCDGGDRRIARSVRLSLPRDTRGGGLVAVVSPPNWIAYCGPRDPGSEVHVSPFEASVEAAVRG
jgi:hypothetical protein